MIFPSQSSINSLDVLQFLSYARILTLDYYFLLICILFPVFQSYLLVSLSSFSFLLSVNY